MISIIRVLVVLKDMGLLERARPWLESRMKMDVPYREALAILYNKWPKPSKTDQSWSRKVFTVVEANCALWRSVCGEEESGLDRIFSGIRPSIWDVVRGHRGVYIVPTAFESRKDHDNWSAYHLLHRWTVGLKQVVPSLMDMTPSGQCLSSMNVC